jgi:hypothetical protein
MPRSRKCASIHRLPHTPSWRSALLVIRDNFTTFLVEKKSIQHLPGIELKPAIQLCYRHIKRTVYFHVFREILFEVQTKKASFRWAQGDSKREFWRPNIHAPSTIILGMAAGDGVRKSSTYNLESLPASPSIRTYIYLISLSWHPSVRQCSAFV